MSGVDLDILVWPFVWRAFVAGATIALSAALLGVTLVLRRLSFIGDGLSHVAFGAMAVSAALGLAGAGLALSLPLTALAAVLLLGRRGRVQGDAALAMLSVGAMAAGYLLMNIFPSSANVSGDVCTSLFGAVSLLTLSSAETWLCVALAVAVIAFSALTYNKSFDIAFDEDFARASGANITLYNYICAIVVAVVIVVSMRLVGALLVSALIVFPVISAMRLVKSYRAVTLVSVAFALGCAISGLLIAVALELPVGATVVAVNATAAAAAFYAPRVLALLPVAVAALVVAPLFSSPKAVHVCNGSGKPSVLVSIAPVYDWTREILGDATNSVNLALLQRSGGDMHSFQPTASDIRDIAAADLFIYVGGVSDRWVNDVLCANPNPKRKALALIEHGHVDEESDSGEVCCDHACEHNHAHAHGHEHGQGDEHVWLSLKNAQRLVPEIADALAGVLGGEEAQKVAANAREYVAALEQLDGEYGAVIAAAPSRSLIIADRFPFADLARDYGLDCHAAFSGCSAEAEASFATIQRLASEVDVHQAKAILILETGDARLARAVRDASKTHDQLILTVNSMQSAEVRYLDAMRSNLAILSRALGLERGLERFGCP